MYSDIDFTYESIEEIREDCEIIEAGKWYIAKLDGDSVAQQRESEEEALDKLLSRLQKVERRERRSSSNADFVEESIERRRDVYEDLH